MKAAPVIAAEFTVTGDGPGRRQRQRLRRRRVHRHTAKAQGRSAHRQLRTRCRRARAAQSHLCRGPGRRVAVDCDLTAGCPRCCRQELHLQRHRLGRVQRHRQGTPDDREASPVIAAELTVTGDVPVDVSVSDCVVAVFTVTLPKLRLAALTVNCGLGAAVLVPPRVTCPWTRSTSRC